MGRGQFPGEFEQIVLLTLAGLETDASGREVYDRIAETTNREVSVAAIHITLGRLHDKGWATCQTSAPAAGKGGKPRRRYRLSEAGAQAISAQRDQLDRLWGRATDHPMLGGTEG